VTALPVTVRTSDPKKPMTLAEVRHFVTLAEAAGAPDDAPVTFVNTVRARSREIRATVDTDLAAGSAPRGLETKTTPPGAAAG
jgi:hypothetical protein